MACEDYPTAATAKTFKLDADTTNQVVTLNQDRTGAASDGKTKKTFWGIENDATLQRESIEQRAEAQFQNIESTFTAQFAYKRIGNISLYVGNSLPEVDKLNSYQYPDDSGEWYGPVQDQVFPITIPADPSSDNGWALVNALTSDSLPLYTDIVYKASGGNSAVENMVLGIPIKIGPGEYCKAGSSEFKRISESSPALLSDFISTNRPLVDDFPTIREAQSSTEPTRLLSKMYEIDFTSGFIPIEKGVIGERYKTTVKRADESGGSNMFILRDNATIDGLIIDGNKDNVTGINSVNARCENRINVEVKNSELNNAPKDTSLGDGFYGKGITNGNFENLKLVGNARNGMSFVDDCVDLTFKSIKSSGNGVVGLDLEPNSTVQSSISIIDYTADGDGLSIQGGGSVNYNSKVVLSNIKILNGALFNMNRVVGVSGGEIFIDFNSEYTIEKQGSEIYGLTDGDINIVKEGVPLNASNSVVNGSFNAAGSGWNTVKNGSSEVEFIKANNAQFGEYVLHTKNQIGEYGVASSQEFDVVGTQYFFAGAHIRAVTGRPFMTVRFKKSDGSTISEHKLGGPQNPQNRWRRPFMSFRVPADAVKATILCGGDASEASEGYFDGVFYYQNSTKSRFEPSSNDANGVSVFGNSFPTSGFFEAGWRHYPSSYVESAGNPLSHWVRKTTGVDHVVNVDWIPVLG